MLEKKRVAIVYDWLDKWGGVERVLLTLHEMFPEAEFFTSYYDSDKAGWAKKLKIRTSFIQKLPDFIKKNRVLSLPIYPYAFESLDFSEYDLVISVTSSFAKSVITRPETKHICYLLTPTRYLWVSPKNYLKNNLIRSCLSPYLTRLRNWDFIAAQRPDKIISISETVADRCRKYYKRESNVIYPPFDANYWNNIKKNVIPTKSGSLSDSGSHFAEASRGKRALFARITQETKKYFLVVSRLEPYKKVEVVTQLINQLSQKLIIVGEGSELEKLKKIAGENIIFLNKVTDEELGYLYSNAEALIMSQEEDFGYVSLEAQFFGCPVIAYKRGGATETIVEGKTGLFFDEQSGESIQNVLNRFNMVKYELKNTTVKFGPKNIEKFSREKFEISFKDFLF